MTEAYDVTCHIESSFEEFLVLRLQHTRQLESDKLISTAYESSSYAIRHLLHSGEKFDGHEVVVTQFQIVRIVPSHWNALE